MQFCSFCIFDETLLTFCDCGCPSFQQVFGCEVQPDLPPGHSDHEKGPVPAAGEDAEPKVDESNAGKEVPATSEPQKSGAAEPEVNENSTATKVPAASCECIFNSLTSSVREEMKCVSVCHLFFDLFRTEGTEKKEKREVGHATDRCY